MALVIETGEINNAIVVAGPFRSEKAAVKRANKLTRTKPFEHFVIHVPENRANKEHWHVAR